MYSTYVVRHWIYVMVILQLPSDQHHNFIWVIDGGEERQDKISTVILHFTSHQWNASAGLHVTPRLYLCYMHLISDIIFSLCVPPARFPLHTGLLRT